MAKAHWRSNLPILLALAGLTLAVYWRAAGYQFIHLDDREYVVYNFPVRSGLTTANVRWAFTTMHAANWHPLTWISHMADVTLFGLNPGRHHGVNVALHLLNTFLLYLALRDLTGARWRSGFVAALFAIHPLHVESVAWIAERKDLLCALFWMLTLGAYRSYVARGGPARYLGVLGFFTLGLLSKPMIVTLPFVLLLLDFWPLGRTASPARTARAGGRLRPTVGRLVLEKVPLFALATASAAITLVAQSHGAALSSFPLGVRVENALTAYVSYLAKTVWPASLAVFYPYPASVPGASGIGRAAGAAILIVSLSLLAARSSQRHPSLAVGWLWYLGTLVPVIGLVQVGSQGLADRYTYLPLVGPFLAVAWGLPALLSGWRRRGAILAAGGLAVLLGLAATAWVNVGYWKDSLSLFGHALQVTRDNWMAMASRGVALADRGDVAAGAAAIRDSLRLKPDNVPALVNLGSILSQAGITDEAEQHLRRAVELQPGNAPARYNLAVVLATQGRDEDAMREYVATLQLDPAHAYAHNNLGDILLRRGGTTVAIGHFREALRLDPGDPIAAENLRKALARPAR